MEPCSPVISSSIVPLSNFLISTIFSSALLSNSDNKVCLSSSDIGFLIGSGFSSIISVFRSCLFSKISLTNLIFLVNNSGNSFNEVAVNL